MAFGEYVAFAEGYSIRQAREWERARMLMAVIASAAGNKVSPTDFFPLRTDVEASSPERIMSDEEVKEWAAKFAAAKWTD